MTIEVKKLSDMDAAPIRRNRTWFNDIDIIYGYSQFPDYLEWGMPKGKISLWAGTAGVGKSRLCIDVAKNFSTRYENGRVLYFQTESTMEDFAGWAKDTKKYDNIECCGASAIEDIIDVIYLKKPKLVFIDSVNEIDEFENGNKREARRLIKGENSKPGLKKAANDVGCHIILLGQINQDGKTIKGGTSLPHLVDIALHLRSLSPEEVKGYVGEALSGMFRMSVGEKHRHGSKENFAWFQHHDNGVRQWSIRSNENIKWQETFHDAPPPPPPIEPGHNIDGTWDQSSPEFRASCEAYKRSPEGQKLIRQWYKDHSPTAYQKIGNFFDEIFNKK